MEYAVAPYASMTFPEHVYQRAFFVWAWEKDRSYRLTARRMEELARIEAHNAGTEPQPSPSHDTIRHWAIRDKWADQVNDILAANKTAGALFRHQVGQQLIMYNRWLERASEILDLDPTEGWIAAAQTKIGEQLSKNLGHLARTDQTPEPSIAPSSLHAALAGPQSREEVAARQLERIRRGKQQRRGKT